MRADVPLGPLTGFGSGGAAEFFAEPPDEEALLAVLTRARRLGMPVRILGGGTNLLVADDGVDGLVIRLPARTASGSSTAGAGGEGSKAGEPTPVGRRTVFGGTTREENIVRVGSALPLPVLVGWALKEELGGLESLAGIPGTVGGALRMNAGGRYGEIGATVRAVHGFTPKGKPFLFTREECRFVYRAGALHDLIVTECELELRPFAGPAEGKKARDFFHAVLAEKKAAQPLSARSAGCVFKNPGGPPVPRGKSATLSAGKLLDEAGMKGFFHGRASGGARISELHANFIICEGRARAADVVALLREARRRVRETHGVELEPEIELWGFPPEITRRGNAGTAGGSASMPI